MKIFKNLKNVHNYYIKITLLSLILCFLWILFINTKPFSDFSYYHNLAIDISRGGAFGDTYTSVGYPIVLGFLYFIFGHSLMVGKIFNVILTMLSLLCLYNILDNTVSSEKKKRAIFTIYALFPSTIFYNSVLGTEVLFTFLLLLVCNLYFSKWKYKYIAIGILVGLNTMIKPFFILFFFLIFIVELIKKGFKVAVLNSFIVLLITSLTIAPWLYRNYRYTGELTFVSNNGGIVLYINNNSQNKLGRWMPADEVYDSVVNKEYYKKASMTGKNKILSSEAKKWIGTHKGEFVVLGFKRLFNTYYLGDDIAYSTYGTTLTQGIKYSLIGINTIVRQIVFLPGILYILAYSVYILYCLIKRKTKDINLLNLFLTVLFYLFTCVYFITEGQARYAFPVIFIGIFFFIEAIEFFKRRKIRAF